MNCKYCGAPPMYKKGDRVKLNALWMKNSGGQGPAVNTKATVLGSSHTKGCVRIVIDGTKTPSTFHQSFLTKFVQVPVRKPMFDRT